MELIMKKHHVLIPGGYGAVGSIIATLLSKKENIIPIVAGRSENQAKKLAEKLACQWITIDLENKASIETALKNIDIVINCYTPSGDFNTMLPELAAISGVHYLDVAAFNKFNKGVIDLHKKAIENKAILITALGLFPGIPGLILGSNKNHFDEVETTDIFFTSGANMDTLSPLALQGIGLMMKEPPKQWNGGHWVKPFVKSKKEHISEPFNKNITFYPYMVTYDLLKIPEIMKINNLNMWSMSENIFVGMILLLGLKMGLAKTVERAKKFLTILRFLGKNKNHDYAMKIVSKGTKGNEKYERIVEMNASEEYLTAIVPVIVCEQITDGDIKKAGAFTGAEIVNMSEFINSLKSGNINYKDILKLNIHY
jgi:saccharopine dehydrogenase-like NADP-dependent oxidoreductase